MIKGIKHVIVYGEPGRFCGWPANSGVWVWGDEILVGFQLGYYREKERDHSIDRDRSSASVMARSLDGGESWRLERPETLMAGGDPVPCPGGVDFAHSGFAMACRGAKFLISYSRGKTWQGPYELPSFGRELTSRTDYIVNGEDDCLFFLSAFEEKIEAKLQDRAFCARTQDGGKTFEFLSWMTPLSPSYRVRSVMPSTVRVSEDQLVSALRRRLDSPKPGYPQYWIDAYVSNDNGCTWKLLSKVADTGKHNGNPPSMVRVRDGRLCVTYGYRATPFGIRARISDDNGGSWGKEIHLRDDGRTWDLGYVRTVERLDGKLVTIYYHTTQENPEQHIVATVWDADLKE